MEEEKKEIEDEIEEEIDIKVKGVQPVICTPLSFSEYGEYMKSKGFY